VNSSSHFIPHSKYYYLYDVKMKNINHTHS
jgi:hypothetical protein